MPQSIFISHVHEDINYRHQVVRWIDDGHLGRVVATSETTDVRQHGDSAIRAHLQPKIRGAAVVLGLIGQNSHNHGWVRYELQVAASLSKQIILARIPGTTGPAPEGFRNLTIHTLDPSTLRKLLT